MIIRQHLREQFYLIIALLIVLFIFNNIAVRFSWYWIYRWLDLPMHFIGGALVTWFCFVGIAWFHKNFYIPWIYALIFSFGLGFIWEVVEFYMKFGQMVPEYCLDTVKDILMDMVGGLSVYIIWDWKGKGSKV